MTVDGKNYETQEMGRFRRWVTKEVSGVRGCAGVKKVRLRGMQC
jgi:hypothetical protein